MMLSPLVDALRIEAEWVYFDIPFLIQAENSIEGNEHCAFLNKKLEAETDITVQIDLDHKYHGRNGEIVSVIQDGASSVTGDPQDDDI